MSEDFLFALFVIWTLGWIPPFTSIWAIGAPNGMEYKGIYAPAMIFLAAWLGVVIVPVVLVGGFRFVAFLWRERPRRVVVPVGEDLREVSR